MSQLSSHTVPPPWPFVSTAAIFRQPSILRNLLRVRLRRPGPLSPWRMGPDSSGEHRPHQLREKLGQLDVGVAGAGFTRQFMDAALGRRQQQQQSLDFQESRTRSGRRIFQAGVASPTYTDATLTVGATVIKANHLKEDLHPERSEERRVGKECRSRWSPYH